MLEFDRNDDFFDVLGIPEEWEDDEETNPYADEDAKILKEYGY